jgi:hypothetical protein
MEVDPDEVPFLPNFRDVANNKPLRARILFRSASPARSSDVHAITTVLRDNGVKVMCGHPLSFAPILWLNFHRAFLASVLNKRAVAAVLTHVL